MKSKNLIIHFLTLLSTLSAFQDTDEYTVFSGTAGLRMSPTENMQECKLNCLRIAKESSLYNYFLEIYPEHGLDNQTYMSLINTIIENIHSTEVHNWQHVMNGPASIDITFSVNTAFLNEMMSQYFQD